MATASVLDGVSAFLAREHGLLIGGDEVEARSGERFETLDNGKPIVYLQTKTVWVDLSV